MTDIEQRVQRGIALLDERVPGWRERIAIKKLDLSSHINCVLGQVFGGFDKGCEQLEVDEGAYGFDLRNGEFYWLEDLTEAWREALGEQG